MQVFFHTTFSLPEDPMHNDFFCKAEHRLWVSLFAVRSLDLSYRIYLSHARLIPLNLILP
jgi:hypothetical protein